MKKLLLTTLFLASLSAGAVEVGISGNADMYTTRGLRTRDGVQLTVGEHFDKFSVTAGLYRENKSSLDKYSLVGGYDVTKFGTATVTAKAGVVYNRPDVGTTGYGGVVGAGVNVPITNKIAMTADYAYMANQKKVNNLDSNNVSVGIKYAF